MRFAPAGIARPIWFIFPQLLAGHCQYTLAQPLTVGFQSNTWQSPRFWPARMGQLVVPVTRPLAPSPAYPLTMKNGSTAIGNVRLCAPPPEPAVAPPAPTTLPPTPTPLLPGPTPLPPPTPAPEL